MSALIIIVAGLSIHVSQIRQSKETCHQNYHELNSTLQSKLSALNSNLSDLKQMHSDLRHQFTEMETKYRSVNETKAQICELLTSRREQTCSKGWITNKDRCYYVSTFETSFRRAMQECSNRDSRLLEINSSDEASLVSHKLLYRNLAHWIGKCENGTVGLALLYNVSPGTSDCTDCEPHVRRHPCAGDRRFICEKSAPLFPDIPEKIQSLCQQPVEST
ncbi:C-type lectin domain family 9 member A-like [Hemitrygon akajei]|uniref:C-type lectin domain family 9 member A-like n=1 Tax=Hemitrygon akajei TaxID=2704970 RepID=UPI003BF9CBC1